MVEGARAREEHVADDAERPHVHGAVVLLVVLHPQLGRHVRGRADLVQHALLLRVRAGVRALLYLPYVSPISPLHLRYISPELP